MRRSLHKGTTVTRAARAFGSSEYTGCRTINFAWRTVFRSITSTECETSDETARTFARHSRVQQKR
jgi:hypothetical protein